MRIRLITMSPEFAAAAKAIGLDCVLGDVRKLERTNTVFVSPANSLGFMDGGIDAAYMRMFPGCQRQVQGAIRALGRETLLGRPYLPVGSALVVSVGPTTWLLSAPTMFLPHDVSSTQNAYHAMMAILMLVDAMKWSGTVVIPSLCCGYGKMSVAESLDQMMRALRDFRANVRPQPIEERAGYMLLPTYDHEQPRIFDNREIGVGV